MERYVLTEMNDENFARAVHQNYLLTGYNKDQYPGYCQWYYGKNIPRIIKGEGEMIFYLDGFIVTGLSVMKKTLEELKICTLLVNPDYREQGISPLLLEDSFDYLGTSKPVITIAEKNLDPFSKIIDAYGWEVTGTTNIYKSPEIIFNDKPKILRR